MDTGGAQEHVVSLAAGLPTDRFEVTVAVGSSGGRRGTLLGTLPDGIRVIELQRLVRELRPVRDLAAIAELRRVIRRVRPDVVHTHSSKAGVLGRLAAVGSGARVVHNVHGWSFAPLHGPPRHGVVLLERLLARCTDALLMVSQADLDEGRALRIRPRVTARLIRSGIDLSRFTVPDRPADRPVRLLGTVGRVAAQKDPTTLLDAFEQLHRSHPELRFRWIGDGPLRAEVQERLDRHGLASAVTLAGERRDVPGELAALDLFVLSSRYEGLPRSLIEAAAASVPIVAADVGGVGEFIDDTTGWLVPPQDVPRLVEAMQDAVDHPTERVRRADAARARADAEFSAAAMCRATAALYDELCAEPLR